MALVSQEPALFTTTIKENIRLGRLDATDEEIVTAAKNANAHDFIVKLCDQYETIVGERGVSLSGGQKQMVAIARAIVEPRKLLLIDEPTKGLAPAIIQGMIAAFRELKQTETILLVEQNFSFVSALGDTVAVMDGGRIVHSGSMAELTEDRDLQHKLLGLSLDTHQ